jgi:hypothetical protein
MTDLNHCSQVSECKVHFALTHGVLVICLYLQVLVPIFSVLRVAIF